MPVLRAGLTEERMTELRRQTYQWQRNARRQLLRASMQSAKSLSPREGLVEADHIKNSDASNNSGEGSASQRTNPPKRKKSSIQASCSSQHTALPPRRNVALNQAPPPIQPPPLYQIGCVVPCAPYLSRTNVALNQVVCSGHPAAQRVLPLLSARNAALIQAGRLATPSWRSRVSTRPSRRQGWRWCPGT